MRIAAMTARYFGGMAPTAARGPGGTAQQLSGVAGNPDACRPRRGSACKETAGKTGVDARPVSALSVQRTAAMSPRFGGLGVEPPPLLFPHFFGRNGGPGRAGPRREAGPPPDRRMISAPTGQGNSRASLAFTRRTARRVVAPHGASGRGGKRADDIRPYKSGAVTRRPGRPAPRGGAPVREWGNPSSGPAGPPSPRRGGR